MTGGTRRGFLGALATAGAALGLGKAAHASPPAIPLPPAPADRQNDTKFDGPRLQAILKRAEKRYAKYCDWCMPPQPEGSPPSSWMKQSEEHEAKWNNYYTEHEKAYHERARVTGVKVDPVSFIGCLDEGCYARGIGLLEDCKVKTDLIAIGPRRLADILPNQHQHYQIVFGDEYVRAILWDIPVLVSHAIDNSVLWVGDQGKTLVIAAVCE